MIKNTTGKAHRLEWDGYLVLKDFQVDISSETILSIAENTIQGVLKNFNDEQLIYLKERPELLLDKLGIDFLIEYGGKRYAIDVTTSKRDGVISKLKKMSGRLNFFDALGAIPVLIRSPNGLIPDDIFNLIEASTFKGGVLDCRLDEDLRLIVPTHTSA